MKRVALFFDGKNFDLGRKVEMPDINIDMRLLADWLVMRVGAEELWGAYYYTGLEPADPTDGYDARQMGLINFLTMLQYLPGFFVKTFPKRQQTTRCPHCGHTSSFLIEKEVDTAIVADMLRLAAVDAFDVLILMSGDADFAPGVDGVRALGKKVYIGNWGMTALANRLREVAFDVIDLRDGVDYFIRGPRPVVEPVEPEVGTEPVLEREPVVEAPSLIVEPGPEPVPEPAPVVEPEPVADLQLDPLPEPVAPPPTAPPPLRLSPMEIEDAQDKRRDPEAFLIELRRAQAHHRPPLYVGRSHFLRNWRSDILDDSFLVREALLDRLVEAGVVEVYSSPDGTARAIRIVDDGSSPSASAPTSLIGRPQ